MNPLEVICASRVINWTANHLVGEASDCPTRDEGRSMNDSRHESSNAGKPFLRFGITIEDSLGGSLDTNRDPSGDLKYREEDCETCASARWSSKNVMMFTPGCRTAHVFYEPESPSVPSAASHTADVSHPISDPPNFVKFFGPAYFSSRFRSPENLLPGVRPAVTRTALDNQSDVLCRGTNYSLCTPSYCTGYCSVKRGMVAQIRLKGGVSLSIARPEDCAE